MKFSRTALFAAVVAVTAAGCAARGEQAPAAHAASWQGDPRLYGFLDAYPIEAWQRDSIAVYAGEYVDLMNELLAEAAEDRNAPVEVRLNALLLLSERTATLQLPVFRSALDDDDPRIRAMAVSAMRRFVLSRPTDALQLARMALGDPSAEVQAQALHVVGEHEPVLLRSYVANAATDELRTIARDLISVAEERGAPLTGDAGSGALRRETSHGYTVTFTPSRRWPGAGAAVGDVSIQRAGAAPVRIDNVEAVAGVLPVFFAPDGDFMVYERDRQIVVRDMATGAERVEGPGVAPRVLPFTGTFVYLREHAGARTEMPQQTRLQYAVMQVPFASGGGAREIGTLSAVTSFATHGGYSPVRWMRVEDRAGQFYLSGTDVDTFALPDPFGG